MIRTFTFTVWIFLIAFRLPAQSPATHPATEWDAYTGLYRMELDSSQLFRVKKDKDRLILKVTGQGQTVLDPLGRNRFRPKRVHPAAIIEFIRDSQGNVQRFNWLQEVRSELVRAPSEGDTIDKRAYAGRYQLRNNPYIIINVREENDGLVIQQGKGRPIAMHPVSKDHFIYDKGGLRISWVFTRDAQDLIRKATVHRTGPLLFVRSSEPIGEAIPYQGQTFPRHSGLNHADTLRGMLTPLRTCYDVLFYTLDLRVMPAQRAIAGSATIRFRTVHSFDSMQVDLFAGLHIEKILFHGRSLPYTRAYNAVFIHFPQPLARGAIDSVTFLYHGEPRRPDIATLQGGFFWLQDKKGNPWIESVCQGEGASLWWPCKDHLSDKPDSMRISITVPDTLMDISNGTLEKVTPLPDHLERYDWYVHYPISTYDVAVNIGKYAHLRDSFVHDRDTLGLDYYCMPYNLPVARQIFSHVKPMLALYEKDFGPYPFPKDGFTLMESIYSMEHQGAVTFGAINDPFNSDRYDTADLIRVAWHESAHEWWGNSVTCSDMADLWFHEAFATYAEMLCYDAFDGPAAALKYLRAQVAGNKTPMIGRYNVNDFHLGDIYPKGSRMIYTLSKLIDNDSLWFALLRDIQQHFRYQSISTDQLTDYINRKTGRDFTPFFDQYLRHAALPELTLQLKKEKGGLRVRYKWTADVTGFNMLVRVTTARGHFELIHPTTEWQTMTLPGMKAGDFAADTDDYFIKVKKE